MELLPTSLAALNLYKQFIVYRLEPKGFKYIKIPVHYATGANLSINDSSGWTDAETAIFNAKRLGNHNHGVGFVFTKNDPFFFLDIDSCLDEKKLKWSELSVQLLTVFKGAAVEVSTSGRGLHVIGSGNTPPHKCKNRDLNIELYTSDRFVALTGDFAGGNALTDCSPQLSWLVESYFKIDEGVVNSQENNISWDDRAHADWSGPEDDELLSKMLSTENARSRLGEGPCFRDLFEANSDVLAKAYPPDPNSGSLYNESDADIALAQHLAFWTGNNCARMLRLMKRSKLVRDKWDRIDYLERTIRAACSRQTNFYNKGYQRAENSTANPAPQGGFLTIQQQIDHFKGCVYVVDEHKILVPGGMLLKEGQFRAMRGGYSFPTDAANQRVVRNAWEAFTESQVIKHPRADSSTFKPDLAPAEIITRNGQTLVNTYWPIETPRRQGDVSPFLFHIEKLVGDTTDAEILISYLAGLIQYKGVKFQWCPIIQGVEGNGKTFFTLCISAALGDRYVHLPQASELVDKFNDWMYGKLFFGVEDIYTVDTRREVIEKLKPMITSKRLDIQAKFGAKTMRDICGNFLINTNHKDGLQKTKNDRRFAPFYCLQQTEQDLKRDGLTGSYFHDLYKWAEQDGYAIIHDYLATYDIKSKYNPAGECQRAPKTSSTDQAIAHGLGRVEQEVQEAIDEGEIGFRKGWVSSKYLDNLLDKINAARLVPPNKRREMMLSIGYDWHPGLTNGRVNNAVAPDGIKSRLYIRNDHPHRELVGAGAIANAYTEDQR